MLADVSHAHPSNFQAAVTLDIGFDTTGASTKKFDIPFTHQIAANINAQQNLLKMQDMLAIKTKAIYEIGIRESSAFTVIRILINFEFIDRLHY